MEIPNRFCRVRRFWNVFEKRENRSLLWMLRLEKHGSGELWLDEQRCSDRQSPGGTSERTRLLSALKRWVGSKTSDHRTLTSCLCSPMFLNRDLQSYRKTPRVSRTRLQVAPPVSPPKYCTNFFHIYNVWPNSGIFSKKLRQSRQNLNNLKNSSNYEDFKILSNTDKNICENNYTYDSSIDTIHLSL